MNSYINGNYIVTKSGYNTKYETFRFNEDFEPSFPDSIDLKITNRCNFGCPYCHEISVSSGKCFDLENTKKLLSQLPNGIEIAIGGGDIATVDKDTLHELVKFCNGKSFDIRATINVKNLDNTQAISEIILPNFNVLGVSINSFDDLEKTKSILSKLSSETYCRVRIVYHVIVGVLPIQDLEKILHYFSEMKKISSILSMSMLTELGVLVLGFKQFGRASSMSLDQDIVSQWKSVLSKEIYSTRYDKSKNKFCIGFDNLAVDQLSLREMLLESEWNKFYLGEDFSHTMYVDAVEETFAPTSRSPKSERVSWSEMGIIDYFKENHKKWSL